MLRIILQREVHVVKVIGQHELKNPNVLGRGIKLDVHAIDENGHHMNVEVQGGYTGSHVRRARFHSSMMDTTMLKEGQDFKELRDSYVIFFYRNDKFRQGLPMYHIDRVILETNTPFDDGSHIIYVNGSYQGDDDIGHLIADFHQKDATQMYYADLASSVRHFKEEEGQIDMCEAVEQYGKERETYGRRRGEMLGTLSSNCNAVRNLMQNLQFTKDQAMDALGFHGEERLVIERELQKQ